MSVKPMNSSNLHQNIPTMKSKSKSEIAMAAGISVRTLYNWMRLHRTHLQRLGVQPNQRLLPPRAVDFVCQELGLHEEDFG